VRTIHLISNGTERHGPEIGPQPRAATMAAMDSTPFDPYQGVALGVECAWPVPGLLLKLPDGSTGPLSSPPPSLPREGS